MRNLKKNPGAKVWTNQVYQKLYKRAPPKREREMNSPMKKVTSIECISLILADGIPHFLKYRTPNLTENQ